MRWEYETFVNTWMDPHLNIDSVLEGFGRLGYELVAIADGDYRHPDIRHSAKKVPQTFFFKRPAITD